MSGFLTHIAARLGAPKGLLRPRTPSLFEPVATAASGPAAAGTAAEGQSLASAFEHTDEVDAPAVATSPPAAGRVLPPQGRRTGAPLVTPDAAALDRRIDPLPDAPGFLPVTRVAARGPRGLAQFPSPAKPMAESETEAARDAPAPTTRTSTLAIRPAGMILRTQGMRARQVGEAPATEQVEARSVAADDGPPQPVSRRSDAGETVADDRRGTVGATTRPTTGAIGILQTPVAARMVSAPLLSPPGAQRSEPTVHVTIGRVEVKALAASPSDRARPGRLSPVMSLDEYLRTRAR